MSLQLPIYLLVAGLASSAPASQVRALQDGIHERIRTFRNLEFQYTVDATFWSPLGSEPPRQTTPQQRVIVNPSPRAASDRETRFESWPPRRRRIGRGAPGKRRSNGMPRGS